MPNYLWSFAPADPSLTTTNTSPQGTNSTGTTPSQDAIVPIPQLSPSAGKNIINVVRDYYWTYSPLGDASRTEVPRIQLTERRLKTNSLVAQLQYTLGAAATNIQSLGQDLNGVGGSYVANLINGLGGAAASGAKSVANSTGNQATVQALTDNNDTTKNSFLQPYRNLYITEPTGWIYTLPYFDNNHSKTDNAFNDTSTGTGGIGDKISEIASKATEQIGVLASPTEYTFVEKTKFYDYDSNGGESITVEFPLINTGAATYDDVVRNWQLLYLLVYQNRPGKTGYNTVEQPVIYEVNIPGTKFFPYCYISNLNVDFVGSRRELALNIPSNIGAVDAPQSSTSIKTGTSTVNAIIPDAYRVSITLKSMTANTRNFMAYMVSSQNVIQTSTE